MFFKLKSNFNAFLDSSDTFPRSFFRIMLFRYFRYSDIIMQNSHIHFLHSEMRVRLIQSIDHIAFNTYKFLVLLYTGICKKSKKKKDKIENS